MIYILVIFVVIFFIYFIYIKVKYPFWSLQPGFYQFSRGIIRRDLPEKNRYTNFLNIDTLRYGDVKELEIHRYLQLKMNSPNDREKFIRKENFVPYFKGHYNEVYLSFYYQPILLNSSKGVIEDKKIVGALSSRPMHVFFTDQMGTNELSVYYTDYLCVNKQSKDIEFQLLQTHYYNQRHLNKSILVNVFKHEGDIGIKPFCKYLTYGFHVTKWCKPPDLPGIYKLLEITPLNFHFLYDFLKANSNQFDILIYPEISNMLELLKTGNMFIYTILTDTIICAYFYRKTCSFIEPSMEILNCFASINTTDNDIFILGFKISFWKTAEQHYFGFSTIENISHNQCIIENIEVKTKPHFIKQDTYFFYNFVSQTFSPQKTLIIQ